MNLRHIIKQGDTRPTLEATLTVNDTAVDLTDADVVLCLKHRTGGTELRLDMTVTSAIDGEVEYAWVDGDTESAGYYDADIEVTFPGGAKQSFPTDGALEVLVKARPK